VCAPLFTLKHMKSLWIKEQYRKETLVMANAGHGHLSAIIEIMHGREMFHLATEIVDKVEVGRWLLLGDKSYEMPC
jgi:hypothetical protein